MGPVLTPARKKRENQYFDVGVQGRRTGIVLPDTGVRDEHGLEPTDGIFSSPEKAATGRRSVRKSNGTLTSSTDMDEAQSSAPEPQEVLTGRRLARDAQGTPHLPVGRSPIKTNLAATPRRGSSIAPRGATTHRSETPHRMSSHPAINRVLDYSITEVRASVEDTPKRVIALMNGRANRSPRVPLAEVEEEEEAQVNGTYDSPLPQFGGDDDFGGDEDVSDANLQIIEEMAATSPQRKRGRPRKSEVADAVAEPERAEAAHRKHGRPRKSDVVEAEAEGESAKDAGVGQDVEEVEAEPLVLAKKRGRPPRVSNVSIADSVEELQPELQPEPSKKRTRTPLGDGESDPAPPAKRGRPKKAPSEKDPNAKISSKPKAKKTAESAPEIDPVKRSGPRDLVTRLREETPFEDDGAFATRSGRLSYKPLAAWKNERAIFNVGSYGFGSYGSLERIIRADDVTPVKRSYSARAASQGRRVKKGRDQGVFKDEQEEEDDEMDAWEEEDGTVSGLVRMWDSEIGRAPEGDVSEQQLAFAASKIEPRPIPDNPDFRFTKTLTMPFFGGGVIELEPGGFKGTKNSRRFQFLFFVHHGKVVVEVAGNKFAITKGGMWQVPRGNFYSISNETDRPAKIVFMQGCEVEPPVAEGEVVEAS